MTETTMRRGMTSIVKKQTVALSGFFLVTFLLAHLSGNFLIILGPEWINGYAKHLKEIAPVLWGFRAVMLVALLTHVSFTIMLALENRAARGARYEMQRNHGGTDFVKKTMIYTGLLIFFYITMHLFDFTLTDVEQRGMVTRADGEVVPYGVYGMVWNAFSNPLHSLLYVSAMVVVGLHLSHAAQSLVQTFGFTDSALMSRLILASRVLGVVVTLGYSSIPLYILVRAHTIGIGDPPL
jgi:succinate dehydrogenase / fumarate reductase, cytochrome b subunit